ncbi:MAG: endonuclease III [Bacteroidota bacterium]
MSKKDRFQLVLDWFKINNPTAETELNYSNPFELLVAVILSAQCTDKRVNIVTEKLFRIYPDAFAMSRASIDEVFDLIRSISYPNNKAKHLVGMANMLLEKFGGKVPSEISDLIQLPGVGRKTANVIVSVVFDKPAMAVDTHVFRVSNRIGLTTSAKTPLETEKQLMKYIPTELVAISHHWIILHGRYICTARSPKCLNCGIKDYCKYYNSQNKSKK